MNRATNTKRRRRIARNLLTVEVLQIIAAAVMRCF
jgi:hypothetical protein